jgi:hypothetical protein
VTAIASTRASARPALSATVVGLLLAVGAFLVYWLANKGFNAGRGDFFYLADAFLHGRTWIEFRPGFPPLGPNDVIVIDGRTYVPFAPFPAIVLAPLVALVGPVTADQLESGVNAFLAATVVFLAWWTAGRIGVERLRDRFALAVLLGFGTQVWWVTTRGGVWHTGHLVAMILTLLLLAEMFGRRRAVLMGLLVGAAFLTRAPVAFAGPVMALWVMPPWREIARSGRSLAERVRALPWASWLWLFVGFAPALVFFFWYNLARFGSATESGYALATLPEWLELQRLQGLFALVHVSMNLDYLFLKLPAFTNTFPYLRPDGLGMSVLLTSPGLLLAALAPWRDRRSWLLLLAAVLVVIPTLLYYGGGWLQFGYRYFLDSIPFVWALCALAVARRGQVPWWGWTLIGWSVLMGGIAVYWAYNLS